MRPTKQAGEIMQKHGHHQRNHTGLYVSASFYQQKMEKSTSYKRYKRMCIKTPSNYMVGFIKTLIPCSCILEITT
jgi:hypothetical protein